MTLLGIIVLLLAFIDLSIMFVYVGLIAFRETRSLFKEIFPDFDFRGIYGSFKKKRNAVQKDN